MLNYQLIECWEKKHWSWDQLPNTGWWARCFCSCVTGWVWHYSLDECTFLHCCTLTLAQSCGIDVLFLSCNMNVYLDSNMSRCLFLAICMERHLPVVRNLIDIHKVRQCGRWLILADVCNAWAIAPTSAIWNTKCSQKNWSLFQLNQYNNLQ